MNDLESVTGEHLMVARRAAGLTQPQLAQRLGIGLSTVRRYERAYDKAILDPNKLHSPVALVAARWAQHQISKAQSGASQ